jgi:hypothetical protein
MSDQFWLTRLRTHLIRTIDDGSGDADRREECVGSAVVPVALDRLH